MTLPPFFFFLNRCDKPPFLSLPSSLPPSFKVIFNSLSMTCLCFTTLSITSLNEFEMMMMKFLDISSFVMLLHSNFLVTFCDLPFFLHCPPHHFSHWIWKDIEVHRFVNLLGCFNTLFISDLPFVFGQYPFSSFS